MGADRMTKGIGMKKWVVIVLLMILGGIMNACAMDGKASWKEEVQLHDGNKQIVERSQIYGGYGWPLSKDRILEKEEWEFHIPGSDRKVVWKSDFRRPPEGDSLTLLQLNFLNGLPYIATSPAGCLSYNHWKRPNPPYVFFKYDGEAWQQIPLSAFPSVFKESNVHVGSPIKSMRNGVITAEMIKEEHRNLELYLRAIVREPLENSQLCPPELTGFKVPYLVPPKAGGVGGK
jgi:hypothetical protein